MCPCDASPTTSFHIAYGWCSAHHHGVLALRADLTCCQPFSLSWSAMLNVWTQSSLRFHSTQVMRQSNVPSYHETDANVLQNLDQPTCLIVVWVHAKYMYAWTIVQSFVLGARFMGWPVALGRSQPADLCVFQCILHYQHGTMMVTKLFIHSHLLKLLSDDDYWMPGRWFSVAKIK